MSTPRLPFGFQLLYALDYLALRREVAMAAAQRLDRVLIVEDDEALGLVLQRIIRQAELGEAQVLNDARMALPIFREYKPDLVVMDIQMPHIDGIAAMQQIRSRITNEDFTPFLLITGDATADTRQRALEAGASDFLTKPFENPEVVLRIRNLLAMRRMQRDLQNALDASAAALLRAERDLVRRLTLVAKYRAPEASSDPEQVGTLAAHIARAMGLPDAEVERIGLAAPLHDIGMIGVPEDIVTRDGSVSLEELDMIRAHTALGARILGNSESTILQTAEEIALYHHESWDGAGYTPGLSENAIPVAARIVAVADTFCAMTGRRPYQDSHTVDSAVKWIENQAGSRFDRDVVQAFLRVCAMNDLPILNSRMHPPQ